MGWHFNYRVRGVREWSESDRQTLSRLCSDCNAQVVVCTGLDLSKLPSTTELRGSSQPPPVGSDFEHWLEASNEGADEPLRIQGPLSAVIAADFGVLVRALRELERTFPGLQASVTDEVLFQDQAVGEIDVAKYVEALQRRLVDDGVDDRDDEEAEPTSAELDARELQLKRVAVLLDSARADFERWKASKK